MPRPATSAWSGSINFGGFPVSLRAYNLIQSRSAQSFKNLCPCHQQPIAMPKRCPVDDRVLDASEMLKGHEVSKGQIVVVPPEVAESVRNAEATKVLEIKALPPHDSLTHELGLATQHYRLVPDEKVPGSEQPANIIWNGLRASERILVTEWIPKAGSRDALLCVEADEWGLTGHVVPYASEIKDTPEFKPVVNEQAAGMFEAFAAQQQLEMGAFHHGDYESAYESRRKAAIEAAMSGKPIEAGAPPVAPTATPDLMAMMAAAVADAEQAKKPARKPAKKAPAKEKANA